MIPGFKFGREFLMIKPGIVVSKNKWNDLAAFHRGLVGLGARIFAETPHKFREDSNPDAGLWHLPNEAQIL